MAAPAHYGPHQWRCREKEADYQPEKDARCDVEVP